MTEWIQSFVPAIREMGFLGYWLLCAVTFAETFVIIGMFVPGTIMLIIMGGLTQYGYYEFPLLAAFAIAGAIIGNIVSYEIGKAGRFHVERFAFIQPYTAGGKAFFDAHGGKSIFMSRFVGPVRPVVPFIAGIANMPRMRFYVYTVLSAIGWCISYLCIGWIFGYAWKLALFWSSTVGMVIGVCVAVVVIVLAVRLYRKKASARLKS